jgi:competence protein ComEA
MPVYGGRDLFCENEKEFDMNEEKPDGKTSPEDLLKAVEAFHDIEALLDEDEDTVRLPLRPLLDLLPADYLSLDESATVPEDAVTVTVDNLFYQLSKGKVVIPMSRLAMALPPQLVRPQAIEDQHTVLRLPLPLIVKAIDPELFKQRTAAKSSRHKAMDVPDPFGRKTDAEPAVAPPPPSSAAPTVHPPAAPTTPATPPAEPEIPAPTAESPAPPDSTMPGTTEPAETPASCGLDAEPATTAVPAAPGSSVPDGSDATEPPAALARGDTPSAPAPHMPKETIPPSGAEDLETYGGVNLNTATYEQLLTLDGTSPAIARILLDHRNRQGPFQSVFDLARIPRIGRKTFRKITGMPYNRSHRHRSWKLAKWLALEPAALDHLPNIARGLAASPGFSGCIISDADGLLLAHSGAESYAETLSAVMPRFVRLTEENARLLNMGAMDSVSMFIGDRMFTTAFSGRICLTAAHRRRSLTKGQLDLIRRVAGELAWLLSHRAYVGAGAQRREVRDQERVSQAPSGFSRV